MNRILLWKLYLRRMCWHIIQVHLMCSILQSLLNILKPFSVACPPELPAFRAINRHPPKNSRFWCWWIGLNQGGHGIRTWVAWLVASKKQQPFHSGEVPGDGSNWSKIQMSSDVIYIYIFYFFSHEDILGMNGRVDLQVVIFLDFFSSTSLLILSLNFSPHT